MLIINTVQNIMLLTNFIRNRQKTAERKGRGLPVRLESRLPNRVRSWWNLQRSLKNQNHLPKTASNPSTTVSQTSKSSLVCIYDFFFFPSHLTNHYLLYIQLQLYIIKMYSNQCMCFVFTGTKSKDNTQFDPNRQAHDFKKKVFVC